MDYPYDAELRELEGLEKVKEKYNWASDDEEYTKRVEHIKKKYNTVNKEMAKGKKARALGASAGAVQAPQRKTRDFLLWTTEHQAKGKDIAQVAKSLSTLLKIKGGEWQTVRAGGFTTLKGHKGTTFKSQRYHHKEQGLEVRLVQVGSDVHVQTGEVQERKADEDEESSGDDDESEGEGGEDDAPKPRKGKKGKKRQTAEPAAAAAEEGDEAAAEEAAADGKRKRKATRR